LRRDQVVQPLIERLDDGDAGVRGAACFALSRVGDPQALEPVIRCLGDQNWYVRWAACEALGKLIESGRRAEVWRHFVLRTVDRLVEHLEHVHSDVHQAAFRALESIGEALDAPQLFCGSCLARFQQQDQRLKRVGTVIIPVCRLCGRAADAIPNVTEVIAVLDTEMDEELSCADGVARVSYLKRDAPFDFDRVEIIRAGDYEVERFCIQVGNDADPFRKGRYRKMRCVVAPECRLSENTTRILRSMFGRVESRV
jgi:hypothetical protein